MWSTKRPAFGVVLGVLLVGCGHAPGTPLERAKRDRASWEAVHVIVSRGEVESGGLRGTFTSTEDVRTGRFRSDLDLGVFRVADGNDGRGWWHQSPGGEIVLVETEDAIARATTDAWVSRRGYLRDGAATYEPLEDGGVRATPDGGRPIDLWFDDAGRLVKTIVREDPHVTTTTYDEYREIDGVPWAFRVVIDEGDPRDLTTVRYTEVRFEDAADEQVFARPALDSERVSFAGGVRTTTVPFDLINHHIYVDATVDGKAVRMLVDTGGVNVLTFAAAERLGLAAEGKAAVGGAGAEKADLAFAQAEELGLGDLRLADPVFYVIDFGRLADVEGVDFDGLVGYELFARLTARIDYPAGTLTLSQPEDFTPPAGATAVPFVLEERTPVVEGAIDGIPARLLVDTGSRNTITANAPFVEEHDLMKKYGPTFDAVSGWGVGGEVRGWPVRFGEITIGTVAVKDVAGDLFTGDKGAMAEATTSANLGSALLKRFAVTFDYANRTMYLEPAPTPLPRDVYDRAGMFLLRAGDALEVASVTEGGPAAKAGLAVGDRITTIDGTPAADRPVHEWREVLGHGTVGEKHTLAVEGRGKVTIELAELLP